MRWQLASTFALTAMSAACYGPNTVDCGDGYLCPIGTQCAEPGVCGEPARVAACFELGKQQFEGCAVDSEAGTCLGGVCSSCTADLAGCAGESWQAMASPAAPINLLAVFALQPSAGLPVTRAYAGGRMGLMITFDGERWSPVTDFPSGVSDISSIWASGPDDVYVVAATKGELFHFNGSQWRNIGAEVPTGADTLFAIAGTAKNDVFAVGRSGTIVRFDGVSWSLGPAVPGNPGLRSAVPTTTGILAVGQNGAVVAVTSTNVTITQPVPPPYTSPVDLNAVYTHRTKEVVVGEAQTNTVTLLERAVGTNDWMPVVATPAIALNAAFGGYVGGEQGSILRDTGGGWAVMVTPGDNEIQAMSGAAGEVFAVGEGGVIWRVAAP